MRDSLPPIRVAVLGPGGIGGLLAALLARRGDPVTCLAPPATAAHLAEHGLELRSQSLGDAKVTVEAATRLDHPVDVVFVTVKATQLEAAVEAVPPEVLSDALVVPFLNGIDHVAWLRERYPADQVVAGTIRIESTRVGPGLIEHASSFAVVELAAAEPSRREQVEALGARLAETGLDVTVRDDEAATLWSKLSILAPIALVTTWTATPYREVKAGHWDEVAAVAREIVTAARADGVDLDEAALLAMLERLPDMRSSMQKDAAAGRPIELDAIGGAVLRAARRAGTEAPVTARLVADLRERFG
jgi:2-dehydropantoate 2-reductase